VRYFVDATEANRELRARSEALGMMTQSVAEKAETVLTEIKRMDAPSVSSRLSVIGKSLCEISQTLNELNAAVSSTDKTLTTSVQVTNIAIAATRASEDRITAAVRAATEAAKAAKTASEISQETMEIEMQAAIPRIVTGTVDPLLPTFDRLTLLLYVLIAEVFIGFIVLLLFR
jgi:predicted transcriptional regulator